MYTLTAPVPVGNVFWQPESKIVLLAGNGGFWIFNFDSFFTTLIFNGKWDHTNPAEKFRGGIFYMNSKFVSISDSSPNIFFFEISLTSPFPITFLKSAPIEPTRTGRWQLSKAFRTNRFAFVSRNTLSIVVFTLFVTSEEFTVNAIYKPT